MTGIVEDDGPLTPEEILLFGPVVEAQVWTPMWLQEARAPIAVAAGRAKLGRVFDDQGVGRAVLIRPCMSRGARLRGLPPIYTPQMLEANASVFDGWPMHLDHAPRAVQEAMQKAGRSVRDLGGQVLKGGWDRTYVHEDDSTYGYRQGAVKADIWATPFVREMVAENHALLHTSIAAWPTAGRPGAAPWNAKAKGMIVEGIRRQPAGSVDFVVRGGAGGRLLVAEGLEDEGEWPEMGEWAAEDERFVVSLAEAFYASPRMSDLVLPTDPGDLREWLAEHAEALLPALDGGGLQINEGDADEAEVAKLMKGGMSMKAAWAKVRGGKSGGDDKTAEGEVLTQDDVARMIQESQAGQPTVEEFQAQLEESVAERLAERDALRGLSDHALDLIESAEGILPSWKGDLKARYALTATGPMPALIVEAATDAEGNALSEMDVLDANVKADLEHVRDLIAEAAGKPRVRGEGGAKRDPADGGKGSNTKGAVPYWRQAFVDSGLAESTDEALEIFGGAKVTGD